MEFVDVWRIADDVVGWLDGPEAELLYSCAKSLPIGSEIVEVGTAHGKSATVLVFAGHKISSVDIDPKISVWPGTNILTMKSVDASERFKVESIDLLFLDGDHEYESVKADIGAWLSRVKPGGMVLFHDYQSWPGVTKAVDEAISAGHLVKVSQAKSMLETTRCIK